MTCEGLVDDTVRIVRIGEGELTLRYNLVALIDQRVGVTANELVKGNEELVLRRVDNPVVACTETLLENHLLAQLILVEILDEFHTRNLASAELETLAAERNGRSIDVNILSHHIQTNLLLQLLVGEVKLHIWSETEARNVKAVVLYSHHLFEIALKPAVVAAAEGASKQVVDINSVSIHTLFSLC